MRSLLPLALVALTALAACGTEDPLSPADDACAGSSSIARAGFEITGATPARVDFDGAGGLTASEVEFSSGFTVVTEVGEEVAVGAERVFALMVVRFLGRSTGSFAWTDPGRTTVAITIDGGPLAGEYRSVAGTTVVTQYLETTDTLRIAGRFCGTLRDSSGRTIEVRAGRFVGM